jgi:hypothetical protein
VRSCAGMCWSVPELGTNLGTNSIQDEFRRGQLIERAPGRPVSESGRLRYRDGGHEGGDRRRRGLVLATLSIRFGWKRAHQFKRCWISSIELQIAPKSARTVFGSSPFRASQFKTMEK